MAVANTINEFDIVELTKAAYDAPAGARGGVLELRDGGVAMIEVLDPPLGPAARIVFVPLAELRLIKASHPRNGASPTS